MTDAPTSLLGQWWFARGARKAHRLADATTDGLHVTFITACGRHLRRSALDRRWSSTFSSHLDHCRPCERRP